jgi:hypothetical protein
MSVFYAKIPHPKELLVRHEGFVSVLLKLFRKLLDESLLAAVHLFEFWQQRIDVLPSLCHFLGVG